MPLTSPTSCRDVRRIYGAALVCFSLLTVLSPTAPAEEPEFKQPVYEIRRAGTPIRIDGKLDEPAWFAAPDVGEFQFTWHKEGRKEQTVAKMLWDDENLYIGHVCEDTRIKAHHTQHDIRIDEDDCFEIMFAPDPKNPEFYFNIEWNVLGGYVDNHRPDGPKKPRAAVWDAEGVRIAGTYVGTLDDDGDTDTLWTAEVAIPFKAFQKVMPHTPPRAGEHWNVNLNRQNLDLKSGTANAQSSQWSPGEVANRSFHQPHRFGRAVFSAKPSPFGRAKGD